MRLTAYSNKAAIAHPGTKSRLGEPRLQRAALLIGRPALGWLFSTPLWWNVPAGFGWLPANYAVTTGAGDASGRAW